ncbi:MAG: heavy-metal-associated domain-containing protein [Rubripirellula sp.]
MRGLAYVIAAIAAVGIMIGIASYPDQAETNGTGSASVSNASTESAPELMAEAGTMTLSVPAMHCEFACFPRVKQSIEESGGVASVELAEQKEEGVIDNRQVIVNYEPGFDLNAVLASLEKEGFSDSDVVQ